MNGTMRHDMYDTRVHYNDNDIQYRYDIINIKIIYLFDIVR